MTADGRLCAIRQWDRSKDKVCTDRIGSVCWESDSCCVSFLGIGSGWCIPNELLGCEDIPPLQLFVWAVSFTCGSLSRLLIVDMSALIMHTFKWAIVFSDEMFSVKLATVVVVPIENCVAPTSRPLQGHANLFQLLPDYKVIDKSKESNLFGTASLHLYHALRTSTCQNHDVWLDSNQRLLLQPLTYN